MTHEPFSNTYTLIINIEKIRRRRMPIRVINRLLENDIHQVSLEEIHEELLSRHKKYLADLKKEQVIHHRNICEIIHGYITRPF